MSNNPESERSARPRARLIIPVWGEKYVARLDIACLPAVLAPGNMPHLAQHFECELAIVTQAALFDRVRALPSVRALAPYCTLVLIPMDDVLSHPSFYGYTITQSFYRGFTSLGAAALDTWCLFLNADFVIADGAYRTLVAHMLSGERLIMAPSYCTIEEDVTPLMAQRIREAGGPVLSLSPRVMADLVLRHRHFTIRSKTINWKMYRIDRSDQFYYMIDNDTMVGKQLPIAIVAFRPERVPVEPVTFWDYGVVSEVCPTSRLCVLADSDDFLMLELRGRTTMSEQLQLGWMDPAEIARDLTVWTTKDQRDCGAFTLVVHSKDLPAGTDAGRAVLDAYFADLMRRVAPEPRSHRDHYIWTGMLQLHADWQRSRAAAAGQGGPTDGPSGAGPSVDAGSNSLMRLTAGLIGEVLHAPFRSRGWSSVQRQLHDVTRKAYRRLFGRAPEVGTLHPLAADLGPAVTTLEHAASPGARALSIWSAPYVLIAPHLSRWFPAVVTASHEDLSHPELPDEIVAGAPFDVCFLELSREELLRFRNTHARLRSLMRKGGKIIVLYRTRGLEHLAPRDFQFIANGLPECDTAEARFTGNRLSFWLQRAWDIELAGIQSGRIAAMLRFGAWVAFVATPAVLLTRRVGRRRAPQNVPAGCTSVCIEITVL